MAASRGPLAIKAALAKALEQIRTGSLKGVTEAALLIQGEAQLKTPVDKGFLKASAVTTSEMQDERAVAAVAYTKSYAPFVHEMLVSKLGNPIRHPVGEAKFLEKAIDENVDEVLRIIQENASIK